MMLYLIGGVSRSGKSIISRWISKRHNIPYFPLDILMSSLIEIGNPLLINYKLASNEIAKQMWPFTKSFLNNISSYNTDFILEGISFWPSLINTLLNKIHIKSCYLGIIKIQTKEKIEQLRSNTSEANSWQNQFTDNELISHIENIKKISHRLKRECNELGFKYFESGNNLKYLSNEIEAYFQMQ